MFNIRSMEYVHPTFERLLLAAFRIKGINTQAELARLLNIPEQNLTNWKSRGVPKDLMIDLADEWGFRAKWIKDNQGEMMGDYMIPANTPEAKVFLSMQHMDETTKHQVVKISDSLAEPEYHPNGHTPPKTGT